MKHAKKLASLLLALVMVFALSTTVYASQEGTLTGGSITINDAVPEQTYKAYQILYLESYNSTNNAYAYKANSAWKTFVESNEIKDVYLKTDAQGYVTWVENADAAAFAKLAQAEATKTGSTISADATATAPAAAEGKTNYTVTFSDLKLGYYLVDTTLGTLCSLDTTNPSVEMQEKNEAPTNEKTVEEDSKVGQGVDAWGETNDADIGQTVNFKSTITAQAGAENYVFHDEMSAGLTYTGVTGITLNGNSVDASNYTVVHESLTDDCTFEVRFTQAFCDTLKANDKIVISYTATLNENAVIAGEGNPNTSKLSYGDKGDGSHTPSGTTPPSTTTTYTWDVDVFKYAKNGEADTALAGAKFTLSKNADGSNPIALVSEGNNVYRVAKTDETGTVTEITTDTTGKFTIKGLDADTYYLKETAAPAGYNMLAAPIKVIIDNNGNVTYATKTTADGEYGSAVTADATLGIKVLNQTGAILPSTGGMGTTVFYVLGGALVLAAVVLLVTRKRMSSKG